MSDIGTENQPPNEGVLAVKGNGTGTTGADGSPTKSENRRLKEELEHMKEENELQMNERYDAALRMEKDIAKAIVKDVLESVEELGLSKDDPRIEDNSFLDCDATTELLDMDLKEEIGDGGQATVHKAFADDGSGKTFAVKVYGQDVESAMAELTCGQKMFLLNGHPNIVKMVGYYVDVDLGVCVVMEYCESGSLYELTEKADLSEIEVARVIKGPIEAAKFLHEHGMMHRDIKLENLFVKEGVVKLGDFGLLGKMANAGLTTCGTPGRTAPEQDIPGACHNESADTYALGHTISLCLKGRMSKACQSLVAKMCFYIPNQRPSLDEVLQDPWFDILKDGSEDDSGGQDDGQIPGLGHGMHTDATNEANEEEDPLAKLVPPKTPHANAASTSTVQAPSRFLIATVPDAAAVTPVRTTSSDLIPASASRAHVGLDVIDEEEDKTPPRWQPDRRLAYKERKLAESTKKLEKEQAEKARLREELEKKDGQITVLADSHKTQAEATLMFANAETKKVENEAKRIENEAVVAKALQNTTLALTRLTPVDTATTKKSADDDKENDGEDFVELVHTPKKAPRNKSRGAAKTPSNATPARKKKATPGKQDSVAKLHDFEEGDSFTVLGNHKKHGGKAGIVTETNPYKKQVAIELLDDPDAKSIRFDFLEKTE